MDADSNWVDGIVLWQPIGVLLNGNTLVYYANNHSVSGLFINDYYSQSVWEEFFWHPDGKGSFPNILNSCVNTYEGTIWSNSIRQSLREVSKTLSFGVNAAGRLLQVYGARAGSKVSVFDMQGRVIAKGLVGSTGNVALEMRRAGSYLVQVDRQVRRIDVK